MPLIIVPAICKERGGPFGDPENCQKYGMGYVALSMAVSCHLLLLSGTYYQCIYNDIYDVIRWDQFTYGLTYTILCGY